jgi:PAS domain S-box-containing protein
MTSIYLPTLLFLAGVGAYAAINHGLLGLRKPINRDHLLLAGTCAGFVGYGLATIATLASTDVTSYVNFTRLLQISFGFSCVLMIVFVQNYTGTKSRFIVWLAVADMVFVSLMAVFSPYTVQFDNPPVLHQYHTWWGESITISNPADGRWMKLVSLVAMALNLSAVGMLLRHYWAVRNFNTLLMACSIAVFVGFSSQGFLVRMGMIAETLPLGPVGIAIIPIAMSMALSREMRDSDRRLLDILDHVPAAVALKDVQGRFLMVNQYYKDLFRSTDTMIIGKTFEQLLPADLAKQLRASDVEVATTGKPGEYIEHIDWFGGKRTFLSLKFPLFGDGRKPVAVCNVSTDITQREQATRDLEGYRERLEELVEARTAALERRTSELQQAMGQLIDSEKLAALGGLVAGVAHELNTPVGNAYTVVTTLQGGLDGLRKGVASNNLKRSELNAFLSTSSDACDLIERNIRRAAELVSSFKQVAVDQTSMSRRRFDLAVLVDETLVSVSPSYKGHAVRLEVNIPAGIELDNFPGAVEQVLTNLVNNAVIHALRTDQELVIRLFAAVSGDNLRPSVQLLVSDNGKGMPEDVVKRAFEPFFTTRLGQGGSGLGLYLVRNLVTGVLGGTLKLSSVHGEGTRFSISLPLIAPDSTTTGANHG